MPDHHAPPGAQAERTALAWRRTALAVATGSLVAGRLAQPLLGSVGWVIAGIGVALALLVALASHGRGLAWQHVMRVADPSIEPQPGFSGRRGGEARVDASHTPPGSVLPSACAAGALVLGLLALAAILAPR